MKRQRSSFYEEIGFRIRQTRILGGLTQEALAERLGVSTQTMQRYETGEVRIPTVAFVKCAKVLGTPLDTLTCDDGQPPPSGMINKTGLIVAAEIMALPDDDIRKHIFRLARAINAYAADKDDEKEHDERMKAG